MPKYYIEDGVEKAIIDSQDPMSAIIKAVKYRFNTVAIGGIIFISERGFRTDDHFVYVNDVLREMEKKS